MRRALSVAIASAALVLAGAGPAESDVAQVTPTYVVKVKDRAANGWLVKRFLVKGLEKHDRVTVACQGVTCPFGEVMPKVKQGKVDLTGKLDGHRLRKLKIEVLVEREGAISDVRRIRITKQGEVSSKRICLAPGSTTIVPC